MVITSRKDFKFKDTEEYAILMNHLRNQLLEVKKNKLKKEAIMVVIAGMITLFFLSFYLQN